MNNLYIYHALFFLLLMLCIGGCSPPPEQVKKPAAPSVISLSSLPPLTEISQAAIPELSVVFLIRKDGAVEDVRLLTTSGDPEWDRAAVDSLRKWRFTSPADEIDISERWIRYRILIEIEDPVFLTLGEIVAFSKEEADSIYTLLREGVDFLVLAEQTRDGTTIKYGSYLGSVNIAQYPKHVRNTLRKLRINRYTRPMKVGDTYVIYKRFEDQTICSRIYGNNPVFRGN